MQKEIEEGMGQGHGPVKSWVFQGLVKVGGDAPVVVVLSRSSHQSGTTLKRAWTVLSQVLGLTRDIP